MTCFTSETRTVICTKECLSQIVPKYGALSVRLNCFAALPIPHKRITVSVEVPNKVLRGGSPGL